MSKKKNCWEYMKCGRGPENSDKGEDAVCPAARDKTFDRINGGINAGRCCWLVAGSFCNEKSCGTFADRVKTCKKCEFYKKVHTTACNRISLGIKNIDIVADSHIGLVKSSNEDRCIVRTVPDRTLILAVADGLGGDVSSDVAAEIVKSGISRLQFLTRGTEEKELSAKARELDLLIHETAQNHDSLAYMATTLVCTVLKADVIYWLNAGDSRFYIFRNDRLIQVTRDHTLARTLVEKGRLAPDQEKVHDTSRILDQCLGYGMCEPETGKVDVKKDDIIVLSTDGLHKTVPVSQIREILSHEMSLKDKHRELIDAALASGGPDNITLVLAHIRQVLN